MDNIYFKNKKINIYSIKAIKILKKYIKYLNYGGAEATVAGETPSKITTDLVRHKALLKKFINNPSAILRIYKEINYYKNILINETTKKFINHPDFQNYLNSIIFRLYILNLYQINAESQISKSTADLILEYGTRLVFDTKRQFEKYFSDEVEYLKIISDDLQLPEKFSEKSTWAIPPEKEKEIEEKFYLIINSTKELYKSKLKLPSLRQPVYQFFKQATKTPQRKFKYNNSFYYSNTDTTLQSYK